MRLRLLVVLLIGVGSGCAASRSVEKTDLAGWQTLPLRAATFAGYDTTSLLLTMRDGVRVAIDVHLPHGLPSGIRVPTILRQTRYSRRIVYRFPFDGFLRDRRYGTTRDAFTKHGYAWVDVDVRGTGASDGVWVSPWSRDEVEDGAEVVSWIVAQGWSNGRVGAMGISYDGAAAEFLVLNRHPAVKAIAPRYAPFDLYPDMVFPGGVHFTWMTENWSRLNGALDFNELSRFFGAASIAAVGIASVPGEERPTAEMKALRAQNLDVHRLTSGLTFRDDSPAGFPGRTMELYSPHTRFLELKDAGVPMYVETGWSDGACSRASIHRFLNAAPEGSRLVIGPWEHGGRQNISPFTAESDTQFDHDGELLRFFDKYLLERDDGESSRPKVAWYTVGAETWRTASDWPPPSTPIEFFFGPQRSLTRSAAAPSREVFALDPKAFGVGTSGRWNSVINLLDEPMPPREQSSLDARRLLYTSPPLDAPLEVTGHPSLELVLAADAPDTAVFVFLEDVDEAGRAWVVTEGTLRAVHRKTSDAGPYRTMTPWRSYLRADGQPLVVGEPATLDIELLPTSWRFAAGHRVRVSLAGVDTDHFAAIPGAATRWTVSLGEGGSRLTLPVASAPSSSTQANSR
ncbi:MAG: CocE/NonD family hydrolase [Myxococcales bacterium]|nr:CocE/NonD family hydrolase [Myxococcales bacterium]